MIALFWDQDMKLFCNKILCAVGFLKYAKKLIPKNALFKMYHGIIEPHFRYRCSAWERCGQTNLQTVQK